MTPSTLPILVVGTNPRNLELMAQFFRKEGFDSLSASKLEDFATYVDGTHRIGIALVDIAGFDRKIWEYCEQCSNLEIPFVIISPQQIASIRQESMAHGAQGVLYKPLVMKELINLVSSMILRD